MKKEVVVTINRQEYASEVPLRMLLVDFIRDVAGLTGTHIGCTYEGRCGACTVVLDGEAVKSCMMLAVQADGANVLTIEGLEDSEGNMHPIQEAFWECQGLQCGYCTPGMLMTVFDMLKSRPDGEVLDEEGIRAQLIGNICRCTGYKHIIEAVRLAGERLGAMTPEQRETVFAAGASDPPA